MSSQLPLVQTIPAYIKIMRLQLNQFKAMLCVLGTLVFHAALVPGVAAHAPYFYVAPSRVEVCATTGVERTLRLNLVRDAVREEPVVHLLFVSRANNVSIGAGEPNAAVEAVAPLRNAERIHPTADGVCRDAESDTYVVKTAKDEVGILQDFSGRNLRHGPFTSALAGIGSGYSEAVAPVQDGGCIYSITHRNPSVTNVLPVEQFAENRRVGRLYASVGKATGRRAGLNQVTPEPPQDGGLGYAESASNLSGVHSLYVIERMQRFSVRDHSTLYPAAGIMLLPHQEYGTRRMKPRPHLGPAFADEAPRLLRGLTRALGRHAPAGGAE